MSSLPATMNAMAISEYGGPEVLKPVTRPVPLPGPGEILIKVVAAGVNRPDVSQRQGKYPPPPGASDLPGLEVSGIVAAVGAGADRYKLGDKVCALVHGGGYAEYVTVHQSIALPVPASLTMIEAAAAPETFFTVWTNVFDRGRLQPGETLLVHGGSSGIGTTAIMLAKAWGATVFVTAGSDEKCAACVKLGADLAINYRTQDYVALARDATGGKGVDVILDMVGGPYVDRNFQLAAQNGRIVQIAVQGGYKVQVDIRPIQAKCLTYTGSTLRPRTVEQKGAISASLEKHVWPHVAQGRIKPVIDSTFAFADVAKAHARMETSEHIGKIVLTL